MKVSVVTASRLAINPASSRADLYLDRAIASVRRQTVYAQHEWELLVGLDANAPWPPARLENANGVRVIRSPGAGQALAVNTAAAFATGDVISFLEDDDAWHQQKMEYQLQALAGGYDFVSCSQREVTPDGDYVRINDFATMSGWIMPAQIWRSVGPMDESFKWHLDTEWLGRLNAAGKKRLHFAEHAAEHAEAGQMRPWLRFVGAHSAVAMTDGLLEPLVTRTVNPGGGMATIARDPAEAEVSRVEHARMMTAFGQVPW